MRGERLREEADSQDICIWRVNASNSHEQGSRQFEKMFDVEADLYSQEVELEHEDNALPEAAFLGLQQRTVPCSGLEQKKKYLMVINAFEQFGGARQALGDAIALAKSLNRTVVEPVLINGRVVNPFIERSWVPLRDMLDVDAIKQYWPHWISIEDFLTKCDPANGMPSMQVVLRKQAISERTTKEMKGVKTKILALSHFMRKGSGSFTNQTIDGVPLQSSQWIAKTAQEVMKELDPRLTSNGYICAHWRSEGVAGSETALQKCSAAFSATVHKVMKCHLWNGYWPKVFLLSDLRNETSDTIHGQALRSEFAMDLDKKLHHHQVGWVLEQIKDRGQRALVEQYICARSRIMVGCPYGHPGRMCGDCSRMQSKFAMQIMSMREELGMPHALNW